MMNRVAEMKQAFVSLIDHEVYDFCEAHQQSIIMLPVIGACAWGYMETYGIVGFVLSRRLVDQLDQEGNLPNEQ